MSIKTSPYTKREILEELESLHNSLLDNEHYMLINHATEHKNYGTKTVSEWIKEFDDDTAIQNVYNKINDLLIVRINDGVVNGSIDKSIAQLALKTIHGWSDRQDVKLSGDVKFILPDFADRI